MNMQRRKRIEKVGRLLEELLEEVEALQEEEQEAYENMPESLQSSERGEAMYEAAENLSSAANCIEEAIGTWRTPWRHKEERAAPASSFYVHQCSSIFIVFHQISYHFRENL